MGIHLKVLAEYSQMSAHFSRVSVMFFASFVLAKLATTSIRVSRKVAFHKKQSCKSRCTPRILWGCNSRYRVGSIAWPSVWNFKTKAQITILLFAHRGRNPATCLSSSPGNQGDHHVCLPILAFNSNNHRRRYYVYLYNFFYTCEGIFWRAENL